MSRIQTFGRNIFAILAVKNNDIFAVYVVVSRYFKQWRIQGVETQIGACV